jgi:hypothetical protein
MENLLHNDKTQFLCSLQAENWIVVSGRFRSSFYGRDCGVERNLIRLPAVNIPLRWLSFWGKRKRDTEGGRIHFMEIAIQSRPLAMASGKRIARCAVSGDAGHSSGAAR